MPTYNYACAQCGPFTARKPIAEFDQPAPCPVCGQASGRTLSVPDALSLPRSTGPARSDNPPEGQGRYKRLHGRGSCACC